MIFSFFLFFFCGQFRFMLHGWLPSQSSLLLVPGSLLAFFVQPAVKRGLSRDQRPPTPLIATLREDASTRVLAAARVTQDESQLWKGKLFVCSSGRADSSLIAIYHKKYIHFPNTHMCTYTVHCGISLQTFVHLFLSWTANRVQVFDYFTQCWWSAPGTPLIQIISWAIKFALTTKPPAKKGALFYPFAFGKHRSLYWCIT